VTGHVDDGPEVYDLVDEVWVDLARATYRRDSTLAYADGGGTEWHELIADDVHWHAQSSACRTYFERNHSPESVLAQYRQLLAEMTA